MTLSICLIEGVMVVIQVKSLWKKLFLAWVIAVIGRDSAGVTRRPETASNKRDYFKQVWSSKAYNLRTFCASHSNSSEMCSQGLCYGNHDNGFFVSSKSVATVMIAMPLSNIKQFPAFGFFEFIQGTHFWRVWVASTKGSQVISFWRSKNLVLR